MRHQKSSIRSISAAMSTVGYFLWRHNQVIIIREFPEVFCQYP